MKLEMIVGVLILGALVFAWYTEMKRRKALELQAALDARRKELDDIDKKLQDTKEFYDKSRSDFTDSLIPPDMLDHIGKPHPLAGRQASLVRDSRSGRLIDTRTGSVVDTGGSGEGPKAS